MRRAFDWLFRNRETGRITIGQFPNIALAIFIVAAVIRRFVDSESTAGTVVDLVATGALLWWAIDELVRGVNPWRRILGAVVLVATVIGVITGWD